VKQTWRSLVTDARLITFGVLIGLGLIYLPTLSHAFVWDDLTFVRVLWPLRDPAAWWTAVKQPFPIAPGYFRPLGVLFLTVEFSLAGRDPTLFHLLSIALHLLNTALVAWLARLVWPDRRVTSIVALLLYGLHPALIEGVAFISSQFDLLLTLCLLLALIADAKIVQPRQHAIVIGGLFLLAALIKEMAVVLVLILPLWQLSRDRSVSIWRAHFRERSPTFLTLIGAGVIYLALRWIGIGNLLSPTAPHLPAGDLLPHALLVARSLLEYTLMIVWPFGALSPLHSSTLPVPINDGLAWLSAAMGLALIGGLVYWIRRSPRSGWLAAAALLSLLPVINVIPLNLTGGAFVAERFLVFPLAMLALALSGPLAGWVTTSHRIGRLSLIGLWCTASLVTIATTVPHWSNNLALWTWASERAPQSSGVWSGLANEYNQRGDFQIGLEMAQRAIQLNPADEWGWNNAGQALFGLGRYDEARRQFEQATRLAPDTALFWSNLGGVFRQQGQWPEAEQNLLKALALAPNEPLAQLNLGRLYLDLERPDLAIIHLQAAIRLLPVDQVPQAQTLLDQANQPEAWLRLANGQLQQGDTSAALETLNEAARRGAAEVEVSVGRCSIFIAQGNLSDAQAACQIASTQAPNDARPYNNLGVIAQQQGDVSAARQYFQRAIELQPDWDLPRQNLAKLPAP